MECQSDRVCWRLGLLLVWVTHVTQLHACTSPKARSVKLEESEASNRETIVGGKKKRSLALEETTTTIPQTLLVLIDYKSSEISFKY